MVQIKARIVKRKKFYPFSSFSLTLFAVAGIVLIWKSALFSQSESLSLTSESLISGNELLESDEKDAMKSHSKQHQMAEVPIQADIPVMAKDGLQNKFAFEKCLKKDGPVPVILMSYGRSGTTPIWQIMGNLTGKETFSEEYTGRDAGENYKFFEDHSKDIVGHQWMVEKLCDLQRLHPDAGVVGFKWKPFKAIYQKASKRALKHMKRLGIKVVRNKRNELDVYASKLKHIEMDAALGGKRQAHCTPGDTACEAAHKQFGQGIKVDTEVLLKELKMRREKENKVDALLEEHHVPYVSVAYDDLFYTETADEWMKVFRFLEVGPREGLTMDHVKKAMQFAPTSNRDHSQTLQDVETVTNILKGTEFENLLRIGGVAAQGASDSQKTQNLPADAIDLAQGSTDGDEEDVYAYEDEVAAANRARRMMDELAATNTNPSELSDQAILPPKIQRKGMEKHKFEFESCLDPDGPKPVILMSYGRSGTTPIWQIMGNLTGKETFSEEFTGKNAGENYKFFEDHSNDIVGHQWMVEKMCDLQRLHPDAGVVGFKWKPFKAIYQKASKRALKHMKRLGIKVVRNKRNELDVYASKLKHIEMGAALGGKRRAHCKPGNTACEKAHKQFGQGIKVNMTRLMPEISTRRRSEEKVDTLLSQFKVPFVTVSYDDLFYAEEAEAWMKIFRFLGVGPAQGLTMDRVKKAMEFAPTSNRDHSHTLQDVQTIAGILQGTEFEDLLRIGTNNTATSMGEADIVREVAEEPGDLE